MKSMSILWLCDQRGSECDHVSQHITIALSEQFPKYIHKFAYYSDHPPHTIRAWVKEADIIICRHPAALEFLKKLNVMKRTVLQFSTTKPNLILEELIRDINSDSNQTEPSRTVKLTEFFLKYCEHGECFQSKAKEIHRRVKNGKIKGFPKPLNKPKDNQTKLYDPDELKVFWSTLKRNYMPNLPNLI